MAVPDQGQLCPDPSAHEHAHQPKLQNQAAGAALYHPQSTQQTSNRDSSYPLDKDGKLSSAGELIGRPLCASTYLTMT